MRAAQPVNPPELRNAASLRARAKEYDARAKTLLEENE
jgi:hypothetical protein